MSAPRKRADSLAGESRTTRLEVFDIIALLSITGV